MQLKLVPVPPNDMTFVPTPWPLNMRKGKSRGASCLTESLEIFYYTELRPIDVSLTLKLICGVRADPKPSSVTIFCISISGLRG